MFRVPERFRIDGAGLSGAFRVRSLKFPRPLMVIASDNDGGWEHVSVSLLDRCPTWDEMCFVKALFWEEEDVVVQIHPAKSKYVNVHPYCLHLWRAIYWDVLQPAPRPPL